MQLTFEIQIVGKVYVAAVTEFSNILITESNKELVIPALLKEVFKEINKGLEAGTIEPLSLLSLSFKVEGRKEFEKYLPNPIKDTVVYEMNSAKIRHHKSDKGHYIGYPLAEEICKAYEEGTRIRDIFDSFNISSVTMYSLIKSRNIPLRRKVS